MENPYEPPITEPDIMRTPILSCRTVLISTGPTLALFLLLLGFRPPNRIELVDASAPWLGISCLLFSAFVNRHTSLITKAACSFSICIVWFYCVLLDDQPMPPLRNILMIGIDIFLIHFLCLVILGFIFRILSRPKR